MFGLALTISLVGVLEFLLALACIVLLVWGVKFLLGLMGVVVPQQLVVILGVILVIILLIWALGGGGGISVH